MKQTYASTFITGFHQIVVQGLRSIFPDVEIIRLEDGIVLYTTGSTIERVRGVRFLNNTFVLIVICKELQKDEPLKSLIKAVRDDEDIGNKLRHILPRRGSYTIMASVENQPSAIPLLQRQKLERKLTSVSSLELDRRNPTVEFWLMVRREGFAFFGIRITRQDYVPERGELRPELAHLLCLLSEPSAHDRFLDPFCGSGAIPIERGKFFPFAEIRATDADTSIIGKLKVKAQKLKLPLKIEHFDALCLPASWSGYFDKIVTDPPWGVYASKAIDYVHLIPELCRVTRKGGIIVLLLSRMQSIDDALNSQADNVQLLEKYDVLVSGQKATAYKLKRL